jgi:S-disulfanyl-L-cysteine oxidoreductase SoxD
MRPIQILVVGTAAVLVTTACSSSPKSFSSFGEQVLHGETLFSMHCAECHGDAGQGAKGPRVVGLAQGALPLNPPPGAKKRTTQVVTVADVANFVVKNMPGDAPGSLTTEQYLAILAFDLKANGIDLGMEKLTMAKAQQLTIPR